MRRRINAALRWITLALRHAWNRHITARYKRFPDQHLRALNHLCAIDALHFLVAHVASQHNSAGVLIADAVGLRRGVFRTMRECRGKDAGVYYWRCGLSR
jgi:hypothetical protein